MGVDRNGQIVCVGKDDDFWDKPGHFIVTDPNGNQVDTANTRRKAEDRAVELSGGLWMTGNSHSYEEVVE